MMRTRLVIAFLVGFCAGFLVRAGRSTAQSLPAYAVSVDTVMQRLQEHQDLFLVDVREERQFGQFRIPGSLNIPLLIYNQHGEDYEQIERLLQNTDVNTVFFLEGGANAYTRFVAQQTQINQGQQNLTTTCSACAR